MRVLVTGGKGQLARDIHACFVENGETCYCLTSKDLDITSYEAAQKQIEDARPDLVVNCAAYTAVDQAEDYWQQAFAVNGIGVRNLATITAETGIPIVHYSTDFVFDGRKGTAYTLADMPNPVNMYGKSKLLGEQCLKEVTKRFYLIRTSWVFGPGEQNFVRKVRDWASGKKELSFVTDQVSSPTYTHDLAQATYDLIHSGRYGLYHMTNAGFCSRFEWASFILGELGWKGTLHQTTSEAFPTPAERPPFSVLDNFGTKDVLGYDLPGWQDATLRHLKRINEEEGIQ